MDIDIRYVDIKTKYILLIVSCEKSYVFRAVHIRYRSLTSYFTKPIQITQKPGLTLTVGLNQCLISEWLGEFAI